MIYVQTVTLTFIQFTVAVYIVEILTYFKYIALFLLFTTFNTCSLFNL